jgi:hypothetical protein
MSHGLLRCRPKCLGVRIGAGALQENAGSSQLRAPTGNNPWRTSCITADAVQCSEDDVFTNFAVCSLSRAASFVPTLRKKLPSNPHVAVPWQRHDEWDGDRNCKERGCRVLLSGGDVCLELPDCANGLRAPDDVHRCVPEHLLEAFPSLLHWPGRAGVHRWRLKRGRMACIKV